MGDGVVRGRFYDECNGVAGFVARYQGEVGDEAPSYRVRPLKREYEVTPKYVLEKVIDEGTSSPAAVEGPGVTPHRWYVIDVELRGGTIHVRLDDKLLMESTDGQPLSAGQTGVYTRVIGGMPFNDMIMTP